MKYRITYADGEAITVDDNPRADYEFEQRFDFSMVDAFEGGRPRHTYVYYLAWASAYYADPKREHREFEDFLSATRSIEVVGDEDKGAEGSADPTRNAQQPDDSSS